MTGPLHCVDAVDCLQEAATAELCSLWLLGLGFGAWGVFRQRLLRFLIFTASFSLSSSSCIPAVFTAMADHLQSCSGPGLLFYFTAMNDCI